MKPKKPSRFKKIILSPSLLLIAILTSCNVDSPPSENTESAAQEIENTRETITTPQEGPAKNSTESPPRTNSVVLEGDILFGPTGGIVRYCSQSFLGTLSPVLKTEFFDPETGNFITLSLPELSEEEELQRIIGCAPTVHEGKPAVAVSYLTQEKVIGLTPRQYSLHVALYEPGDSDAIQVGTIDLGSEFHYSSLQSYGDVLAISLPEEVIFLDSEKLNPLWSLTGEEAQTVSQQGYRALVNDHQYVLIRNQELRDPRTGETIMEDIDSNYNGLFYRQNGTWFLLTSEGKFRELPEALSPFISAISLEHVGASFSGEFLVFTGSKFAAINLSSMEIPVLMDYEEFEATNVSRTRVGEDGEVYFSGGSADSCSMIKLPNLEDEKVSCDTPVSTRDLTDGWSIVYKDGLNDVTAYAQR